MKTLLTPRKNSHDIATGNAHSRSGRDMISSLDSATIPNLEVVKARQKATWESGDFGQIARTIENVAAEPTAITHMYNKENLTRLKKMDALAPEVMKAFGPLTKRPSPMGRFL